MNCLFIFGTRPEAIKMASLIKTFHESTNFDIKVCITAQHREMLDQVLDFFDIKVDYDLNLMKPNQTLFDITSLGLKALEGVFKDFKADIVFVQGDTTSCFIGALAAFYNKIKVVHIEAGLRSFNKYSPFPEEINREMTSKLATYHFAPTPQAKKNLAAENIHENVWMVGNTVIDGLLMGLDIIKQDREDSIRQKFEFLDFDKRIVLVTGHRRESFGEPFENITLAIKEIAQDFEDVQIVYPVHLNPNVREVVNRVLNDIMNVFLIEPLEYPDLIWLMDKSYLVLTDSGGIQEEAPALGKPVLVMRDVTERMEGVEAGTARLVGTDKDTIYRETSRLLSEESHYKQMANAVNPYGDGTSSKQILKILEDLNK